MASTLQRMNKEITVLGLAPMQFIFLCIVQIGFYAIYSPMLLITIPLSVILGNILARNNKKGNPDYLSSLQNQALSPRTVDDVSGVMKYIIRK